MQAMLSKTPQRWELPSSICLGWVCPAVAFSVDAATVGSVLFIAGLVWLLSVLVRKVYAKPTPVRKLEWWIAGFLILLNVAQARNTVADDQLWWHDSFLMWGLIWLGYNYARKRRLQRAS